jgi:hypothetical protein
MKAKEPTQSFAPNPALSPLDLCQDLLSRLDQGNKYARLRKQQCRRRSSAVKVVSLLMSAASTIILGLQSLDFWTATGFVLVALITVANTLEPFFAWRNRWVLMEHLQYRFQRLRDDLTFYFASTAIDELDKMKITEMFDQYQQIWYLLNERYSEYRRAG